jgi:membrane protein insertase Oxa1/YidC/SpoIIIJ
MKPKKKTVQERLKSLEAVVFQLYTTNQMMQKEIKILQDKVNEDKTEDLNYL